MKKTLLILSASAILIASTISSCSSPQEKVNEAEQNVVDANIKLEKANEAYLADIENYRKETAAKTAANDKSIAEFKARIESDKKDANADYKKKIAALEQKNSDMKMKMDNYKAEGKDKWEAFKTEFNHDMEEIGQSFKDLTVKNTK